MTRPLPMVYLGGLSDPLSVYLFCAATHRQNCSCAATHRQPHSTNSCGDPPAVCGRCTATHRQRIPRVIRPLQAETPERSQQLTERSIFLHGDPTGRIAAARRPTGSIPLQTCAATHRRLCGCCTATHRRQIPRVSRLLQAETLKRPQRPTERSIFLRGDPPAELQLRGDPPAAPFPKLARRPTGDLWPLHCDPQATDTPCCTTAWNGVVHDI